MIMIYKTHVINPILVLHMHRVKSFVTVDAGKGLWNSELVLVLFEFLHDLVSSLIR